ncbi:unnamed protein product [Ilex paraguariensis]|uniref:NADP-dependent oxidoreductase domain-containing protein n=1 Tax=Ilex paraguariensis TaxID=185542 RepID=A0ABC8U8A1_9AQUA
MAVPLFNLAPDLAVSRLCLGTMTFGEQNTMVQSFQLLDKAFDAGINFFDSAEMYPVPQRAETQGRSEEYLGCWIRQRKIPRDSVVFATKVCGPSGQMTWIRDGPTSLDARNITIAIDNSLLRLQTDYIDLYQIHWPDRYVPMFGETEYDLNRQFCSVSIEEQLDALGRAVNAGKIRYIGLSNETPYGMMKFLQIAETAPLCPRIVSVQNSYNLLCRNFDSGMAECCHHESPLAMGILSGKYFSPEGGPADARLNLLKGYITDLFNYCNLWVNLSHLGSRFNPSATGRYSEGESRYKLSDTIIKEATRAYLGIARKYNVHPVYLAIAFVLRHPLVASAICGATKLWQLQEILDACEVKFSPDMKADIDEVHSSADKLINNLIKVSAEHVFNTSLGADGLGGWAWIRKCLKFALNEMTESLDSKTICNFSCLSKEWRNLIPSSCFKKLHRSNRSKRNNPLLLLLSAGSDPSLYLNVVDMNGRLLEENPIQTSIPLGKIGIYDSSLYTPTKNHGEGAREWPWHVIEIATRRAFESRDNEEYGPLVICHVAYCRMGNVILLLGVEYQISRVLASFLNAADVLMEFCIGRSKNNMPGTAFSRLIWRKKIWNHVSFPVGFLPTVLFRKLQRLFMFTRDEVCSKFKRKFGEGRVRQRVWRTNSFSGVCNLTTLPNQRIKSRTLQGCFSEP